MYLDLTIFPMKKVLALISQNCFLNISSNITTFLNISKHNSLGRTKRQIKDHANGGSFGGDLKNRVMNTKNVLTIYWHVFE